MEAVLRTRSEAWYSTLNEVRVAGGIYGFLSSSDTVRLLVPWATVTVTRYGNSVEDTCARAVPWAKSRVPQRVRPQSMLANERCRASVAKAIPTVSRNLSLADHLTAASCYLGNNGCLAVVAGSGLAH